MMHMRDNSLKPRRSRETKGAALRRDQCGCAAAFGNWSRDIKDWREGSVLIGSPTWRMARARSDSGRRSTTCPRPCTCSTPNVATSRPTKGFEHHHGPKVGQAIGMTPCDPYPEKMTDASLASDREVIESGVDTVARDIPDRTRAKETRFQMAAMVETSSAEFGDRERRRKDRRLEPRRPADPGPCTRRGPGQAPLHPCSPRTTGRGAPGR